MGFLKKAFVSLTAILLIFSGSMGVGSSNIILQIGAFIGIIVGLVILYIFIKMAWRAMGCLPAILIMSALAFFVMYAIGAFSDGMNNIPENIKEFLGQNIQTSEQLIESEEKVVDEKPQVEENGVINLIENDNHELFKGSLKDKILPKTKTVVKTTHFDPMKYPAIYGPTRVLSGDTLVMNGYVIKLYAVAAPDIKQTCAAQDGRGYRCGQQSAMWLSEWLSDNQVECHIVQDSGQGYLIGVCMLGAYDIGAAIVNAGWAVANPAQSKIYEPYQNQAIENRRGMWDGKFYMPWDWYKIQNRKANIQIIRKKKNNGHGKLFSFF
ncbi:MAG: thermonuclease family protein [Alphaproteobacteria bacterium]|nr:thermonuclease family protein [Alphaproteobacteria bacterium]